MLKLLGAPFPDPPPKLRPWTPLGDPTGGLPSPDLLTWHTTFKNAVTRLMNIGAPKKITGGTETPAYSCCSQAGCQRKARQ